MASLIGQQVDQYRIETFIGHGPIGYVYKAQDTQWDQAVVLKFINPKIATQTDLQAFLNHATDAVTGLSHEHIVQVYSSSRENGRYYIVSDYIAGRSLDKVVQSLLKHKRVMQLDQALHIIAQLADGLAYTHEAGVLHGNLKPTNVLIQRNNPSPKPGQVSFQAWLSDFSLSMIPNAGVQAAKTDISGILPYLSPEQCKGSDSDGRSDIYGLGVLLYLLLTGRVPFEITSPTEAIMRHALENPLPVEQLRAGLPERVIEIVQTALAKNPSFRFQLAEEMADALRQATTSPEINPAFSTPVVGIGESNALDTKDIPATIVAAAGKKASTNMTAILTEMKDEEVAEQVQPEFILKSPTPTPNEMMALLQTFEVESYGNTAVKTTAPPQINPAYNETPFEIVEAQPTDVYWHEGEKDKAYLVISHQGRSPRYVNLDQPRFRIGRAQNNDIVLSSQDVSRHHVFLEKTEVGWELTDLGSSAGTYWKRIKLTPDESRVWPASETIQIGSYFLHWQSAEEIELMKEADVVQEAHTELFLIPDGGIQRQSVNGRFNGLMHPSLLTLDSGMQDTIQIELFNQGATIDTFKIDVSGLPTTIFTLPQNMLSLTPGARASVPLLLQMPQKGTLLAMRVTAGDYPFRITVQSITFPSETAVLSGQISINPFEAFSIGIWPGEVNNNGTCRLLLRNEGNIASNYKVISYDKTGMVQFLHDQRRIELDPGATETQDIIVEYRERPLFGRNQKIPFELEVLTENGTKKTKTGYLNLKPKIPLWVILLLEVSLIFMLSLAIILT